MVVLVTASQSILACTILIAISVVLTSFSWHMKRWPELTFSPRSVGLILYVHVHMPIISKLLIHLNWRPAFKIRLVLEALAFVIVLAYSVRSVFWRITSILFELRILILK